MHSHLLSNMMVKCIKYTRMKSSRTVDQPVNLSLSLARPAVSCFVQPCSFCGDGTLKKNPGSKRLVSVANGAPVSWVDLLSTVPISSVVLAWLSTSCTSLKIIL